MKKINYAHHYFGFLALISGPVLGAPITWGTPKTIVAAADISNPAGSTVHIAADFNTATGTAVGDDNTINGIVFTETPMAGGGNLVTSMTNGPSYGTTYFPLTTGDLDLDAMLDAHAYTVGNPAEVTITINSLIPGTEYQVQLIAVADGRTCCAGRTYEPDDGLGSYTTGITMARGQYMTVLGTFTANSATQVIKWRSLGGVAGNSDPGFSGLVVLALPNADDSDGDGLTDAWETLFGLDPNDDDSDGDLILDGDEDQDMDGLNNLGEQAAGTNPNDDDSDDDGYLDGVETNTQIWVNANDTGSKPLVADSDGDGLRDGVENPDLPFVDANQTGSNPNLVDTDSDNLPDNVEVTLGLNPNNTDSNGNSVPDGDEDFDNDGLSNQAELIAGTGISDSDSDDDNLLDGVETKTGIWVSVSNTGTNPLDSDTDKDSLLDGIENPDLPYLNASQPGTNPNRWDSDGDLRNDAFELTNGSDPTDPLSAAALPAVSFRPSLIGGDLTDPENDGIDTEDTAGTNFNWVGITSSSKSFFTDTTAGGSNEGAFDVFDNKVGPGEAKWCCDGAPQDVTVEFADPVSITYFTLTSSNDSPERDPVNWEILGSHDGITFAPIYSSTGATIWNARNQTALFMLESPSIAYKFIRYSVTATGGTLHALGEIEYFGNVGGEPLQITNLELNGSNVTLTWTSNPGRNYAIYSNNDLGEFTNEINDFIPSDGAGVTSFTFFNTAGPKQFFIVIEN